MKTIIKSPAQQLREHFGYIPKRGKRIEHTERSMTTKEIEDREQALAKLARKTTTKPQRRKP